MIQSDFQLLQEFLASRSEEAFSMIVERHAGWMLASASRQLRRRDLAEDAVQTVFTALAQQAAKIPENVQLSAWLFTALRYTCSKTIRSETRRQKHEGAAMKNCTVEKDSADDLEIALLVDQAVEKLGAADRDIVLLRFFEGMSFNDIAARLNIGVDAAGKRASRAIEKLRGILMRMGITSVSVQSIVPAIQTMSSVGKSTAEIASHALSSSKPMLPVIKVAAAQFAIPTAVINAMIVGASLFAVTGAIIVIEKNNSNAGEAATATPKTVSTSHQVKNEFKTATYFIQTDSGVSGAYSIPRSSIRLIDALKNARQPIEADRDFSLQIIRRTEGSQAEQILSLTIGEAELDGKPEYALQPGDLVLINKTALPLKPRQKTYETTRLIGKFPNSGTYYLGGNIDRAGSYANVPSMNLLQVLVASAASLDQIADSRITIIRKASDYTESLIERRVSDLILDRDTDLSIEPCDVIILSKEKLQIDCSMTIANPKTPTIDKKGVNNSYYISGSISSPGQYSIPECQINLLQALISTKLNPADQTDYKIDVLTVKDGITLPVLETSFKELLLHREKDILILPLSRIIVSPLKPSGDLDDR